MSCAAALALAGLLLGCERERHVPYIPPTLAEWPRPYRGVDRLRVHVFRVGTLRMLEGLIRRGGSFFRHRDLSDLAFVIQHPVQGMVVINTGLNRHLAEAGAAYLGGVEQLGVEVELNPGQDLPSQMRAAGLAPETVRWVILSTLRFPQAGEVEAFPEARVVVSRSEHQQAFAGGYGYVRREFDEVQSWKLVDPGEGRPVGTFSAALDLFGDGSCVLIDASGPTDGHLAPLLRLPTRPLLLAGDLAPLSESARQVAAPLLLSDMDAWWDRIWRLKRFQYLEPALLVVPGYDPGGLETAALPEVRWHEFAPATKPTRTPRR